mmetsp:Transcript_3326/g.7156  ORF Transcript_3326/g.7156 Transcript_3326/m.7156 type:complete len:342 (-) Transcript_3326:3-1028(-)
MALPGQKKRQIVQLPGLQHTPDWRMVDQGESSDGLFSGITNFFGGLFGGGANQVEEGRFISRQLIMGQPEVAAAGLKSALGLGDDMVLSQLLSGGVDQIVAEFKACGSESDLANLHYCLHGVVGNEKDIPPHVLESYDKGYYHGGRITRGDFDYGHAGMRLEDFMMSKHAQVAELSKVQVLALRLYTTSSYPLFNGPLRKGQNPHPLRMTVYHLAEALKCLRRVEAQEAPEEFNKVMLLYRGMKDTSLDQQKFMDVGGTETAPMSTSAKKDVALSYAASRCPLMFQFKTRGLGRGVSLSWCSCYPLEEEFLYPPMTYLQPEGIWLDKENTCIVVEVVPQMS